MNNKKLLSIITLAGVVGMNVQSIAQNTAQSKNTILLANRNISSNIQEKVDSNIHNIKDNVITIDNFWGLNIATIKFNPETSKIQLIKGNQPTTQFISKSNELFSISLYKSNGELVKTVQVNGDEYPEQELYNSFNNLDYSYGDIIRINYKQQYSLISVSNFDNQKNYQVNKPISMEITKDGLKELSNNLTVNPIYFDLGSNKINVSGNATPDSTVNIWVDNKDYITTANSKGQYNKTISASENVTSDTVVEVFNQGNNEVQKKPQLNPKNYKLNYTSISLDGYWGGSPYLVSKIGFNQYTNKLEVENKGNIYFSWWANRLAYTITLFNKNGEIVKSEKYYNSGSSQNVYDDFNGLSFQYGGSIRIQSNGLDMSINNPDGKIDNIPGKGTTTVEYEITPEGLKTESNNLTVNPIYYELNSNKISISGKTAANKLVNVWVYGKDYTTTSNSEGEYNLNIVADKNITASTKVEVFVEGEQNQTVNPVLNPNVYKIVNSKICINNGWGSPAGTITFNPISMQIEVSGYNLYLGHNSNPFMYMEFINKNTSGNISEKISSKIFYGNNNTNVLSKYLNGKVFKYGDVIGFYYDSSQGSISVFNGSTNIDTDNNMQYYEITKEGLKKVTPVTKLNSLNILTSTPIYSTVVTGQTLPNSKVTVYVDGQSFVGTSDSKGDFDINIKTSTALNTNTKIVVSVNGTIPVSEYPTARDGLASSGIYISTSLNGESDIKDIGGLLFNPITKKIEFVNNGVGEDPLQRDVKNKAINLDSKLNANVPGQLFTITLLNSKQQVIKSKTYTGNDTIRDLYNDFNGLSFNYGDYVNVSFNYAAPLDVSINILNKDGAPCPDDPSGEEVKITKDGFVNVSLPIQAWGIGSQQAPVPSIYNNYESVPGMVIENWQVGSLYTDNQYPTGGTDLSEFVENNAMKELVAKLTKGCTTDYEKAKAIAAWCDKVPYEMSGMGKNAIYTFEHGGVCENKAILYAVLCQQAGLAVRVISGNAYSGPTPYMGTYGAHAWNEVWLPSQNRWMTVDTTWEMFDCKNYVDSNRSQLMVEATLWDPNRSYQSYFVNDPSKAWEHLGQIWNQGPANYYKFNQSNNPELQQMFDEKIPSRIVVNNGNGAAALIEFNTNLMKPVVYLQSSNLGNSSGNFFNLTIYDAQNHRKIFSKEISGDDSSADLRNILENVSFKYGDIIQLSYNRSQGNIQVLNGFDDNVTNIGNSTGKTELFKITKNGLEVYKGSLKAESTITVEAMVDGKVLGKPVETTNYEGEAYKEVAPTWDNNDYELKDITVNGVKTSESDLPKVFGDKDTTIVYNLSPKMMNVGERVVNQNGDVLYHNEYKLPFNTSIVNIEDKIPSNYKLENITVSNPNNKEATLIANKNINTYTNSNDVKVAFNGEVVSYNVVPINGEITYETQIGNEEPTNVVKEVGQVDTKSKEYKLDIPAGYEVESITVNGKKVDSINDLDYTNEKQVVVYHLAKIPSNSVTETMITNTGKVLIQTKTVKIAEENTEVDVKGLTVPAGYKLEKVTIDGKEVKAADNYKVEIGKDTTSIVYVVEKIPSVERTVKHDSKPAVKPDENHKARNTEDKPVVDHNDQNKSNTDKNDSKPVVKPEEQGEVIIKVIDQNGKTIEKATHTGVLGLKFNPITIPSKDKLVNITVNGKIISENDVKNEIVSNPNTDNKTTIIYNVEVPEHKVQKTKPVIDGKVIIKVVNQNGKVIENVEHEGAIGSKFNSIQIPKNDKVISVTVNGNEVNKVPDVIEENSNNNTTTIIYNVNVPENNTNDNQGRNVNSNDKTYVNSTINNGKNNSTNTHDNNVKTEENNNGNNSSDSNKKNVTENGNVNIEVITDNGRVIYSTNSNEVIGSEIKSVNIPSGYHIDSVDSNVNGTSVNTVPTKVVKGDIVIIYHVSKIRKVNQEPAKEEKGTVKVEIITNDGKVLLDNNYNGPVGSEINNIDIPNGYKIQSVFATVNGNKVQEVPTKVEKGETTIIYNVVSDQPVVNSNGNTSDNHNDAKPVVDHKGNTIDNYNSEKSAVNHNKNTTDNHNDTKPALNHNGSTTDNHKDIKSEVNHSENTIDNNSKVNSAVNHNNSNSESINKGNNGETVNKIGLPDTGLKNTENDLGLLAGIMAAIAAIGIFRRKK